MRYLHQCVLSAVCIVATTTMGSRVTAWADTTQGSTNYANVADVQVQTTGPADAMLARQESKYPGSLIGSTQWHGFYAQSGRDITVNLTYDRPIQQLSIELEQNVAEGIYYPSHVDFQVNLGGTWYELGSVPTQIPNTDLNTTTQVFSVPCNNLNAHLFRIHFPVPVWVFARNLQVIGNPFLQPTNTSLPILPKVPAAFSQPLAPTDQRAGGIHNMLLAYTGANGSQGTWSAADFLPMTAYVLPDGSIGGRMFDTIGFLPYSNLPDTQLGWGTYLQDLFAPNQQLAALDQAMTQTDAGLARFGENPDTKENVVLTLPYPKFGDGVWGSIAGQTVSFSGDASDPAALSSRDAAMQWYLGQVLADWQSAHFAHLKLVGIDWQAEEVHYPSPGDTELIENAVTDVHANHLPLFWIPFYGAPGLADWQRLGFDAAWIQPNYVESGATADPSRLANTEQLAKDEGMGVEVEAPWQVLDTSLYRQLYRNTLSHYQDNGFGSRVSHVFYAGSKVLVTAATSTSPAVRAVYDATYGFLTHN